jgi:N-acetyl-gamma-glutamyl-phosphate reductase
MQKTKVSIIGGAGYGAAEILRHVLTREDVELLRISSKDYIGQSVSQVHRNLPGYDDVILQDISPKDCVAGADIVFLAMPHIITARVAMELLDEDVRIIDLSGDFRLENLTDYTRDYAPEHPCPEKLGSFVYGMPELNSEAIKEAKHVASPGCFATCIAMGLLPLADAGLLKGSNVRTVAMTGSSGSGVKPQVGTHHATRVNNMKAYKTLHHQHRAEIIQTLGHAGAEKISLDFVPVSAPLVRGILAVSQLDLPDHLEHEDIEKIYQDYYADHLLTTVRPKGAPAEVVAVTGTAKVEIGICKGKKIYDKREVIKARETKKSFDREMKQNF